MISPLLLNIALHGLEAALGVCYNAQGYLISSRAVVRYADDLVVFCESKQDAERLSSCSPTGCNSGASRFHPKKPALST